MTKTWHWIIGGMFLSIAGCAVNDRGVISTHYFENESSYLVIQESWGGYLSTRQVDRGLTLGHTERIMIYPKQGTKSGLSIDELFQESNGYVFDREIEIKDIELNDEQLYAWIEKNQGIMLHANAIKIGFSFGMESSSAIRLPTNFDGILMFNYRENGTIEAVIDKTSKTK